MNSKKYYKTKMKSNFSLYDRFINPFSPKTGVDELPDFIPDEHYIQVKNLCEEATRRIIHSTHQTNELSKINELLKTYEYLFDETEIWIKLYSGFDEFSFLYLELCEIKVVLVEYPMIIKKALFGLNQLDKREWLSKNRDTYQFLNNKLPDSFNSHESLTVNISTSNFKLLKSELNLHLDFLTKYKQIESAYLID